MYYNFYAELKKHEWTQEMLADFLGITITNVNMKLRGKQGWSITQIKKLCKEFNTTFEYLFETKED